jgi:hypothetical protein
MLGFTKKEAFDTKFFIYECQTNNCAIKLLCDSFYDCKCVLNEHKIAYKGYGIGDCSK